MTEHQYFILEDEVIESIIARVSQESESASGAQSNLPSFPNGSSKAEREFAKGLSDSIDAGSVPQRLITAIGKRLSSPQE